MALYAVRPASTSVVFFLGLSSVVVRRNPLSLRNGRYHVLKWGIGLLKATIGFPHHVARERQHNETSEHDHSVDSLGLRNGQVDDGRRCGRRRCHLITPSICLCTLNEPGCLAIMKYTPAINRKPPST